MSAETPLKQLFPVDLGSEHDKDLTVDGRSLDAARQSIDTLLREVFPDTTSGLLLDWERVLGLTPSQDDPMLYRLEQVARKIRERGGLSIAYFVELAASIGYTITIVEPKPFMAGWGRCGDCIYSEDVIFQWGVVLPPQPVYHFRAGQSCAGDRLLWWDAQSRIEELFCDLAPAHTQVHFIYTEE